MESVVYSVEPLFRNNLELEQKKLLLGQLKVNHLPVSHHH